MALGLFPSLSQSHLTWAASPQELQVPPFYPACDVLESLWHPQIPPAPSHLEEQADAALVQASSSPEPPLSYLPLVLCC